MNSLYQSSRNKRPSCHQHIRIAVDMVSRDFSMGVADYLSVVDMVAVQVVVQMGALLSVEEGPANDDVGITVRSWDVLCKP